nr:DNA helicase [Tanacetum cinerariifolium]
MSGFITHGGQERQQPLDMVAVTSRRAEEDSMCEDQSPCLERVELWRDIRRRVIRDDSRTNLVQRNTSGTCEASSVDVGSVANNHTPPNMVIQEKFPVPKVPRNENKTDAIGQHTLVRRSDLWRDVKKRVVTESSYTSYANNNELNKELGEAAEKLTWCAYGVTDVCESGSSNISGQEEMCKNTLPTANMHEFYATRDMQMSCATNSSNIPSVEIGQFSNPCRIVFNVYEPSSSNTHKRKGVSQHSLPTANTEAIGPNRNVRRRLMASRSSTPVVSTREKNQNVNTEIPESSSMHGECVVPSFIDFDDFDQRCHHYGCLFWYGERLKDVFHNVFGAKIDDSVNKGKGPYMFKVSGQIYHWISSLCPDEGHQSCFLQLYIYDTQNEVDNRMRHFGGSHEGSLDPEIVDHLIHILDEHNELVKLFRTARDKCRDTNVLELKIMLYNMGSVYGYELPAQTLGGIEFESGPRSRTDYDVIIEFKGGPPQRISKLHQSYASLQFSPLFIFGQPGFYPKLKLKRHDGSERGKKSFNERVLNQLHPRVNDYGLIFKGGRLFQQYFVVVYYTIEQNRIDFIRTHQNNLRREYLSGPRYMYSHYLDALALCRSLGNPQFFITFPRNVNWHEIKRYMKQYPELTPADRPDVVCRVFEHKVKDFVRFLREVRTFGYVTGVLYTIEFQKRGLPHWPDHILAKISRPIGEASASASNQEAQTDEIQNFGLEVGSIRRIQGIGYIVLEFLGVGTTLDIFDNIILLYFQYGVLVFYEYGVLSLFSLSSLVSAGTDTPYLPWWIRRIGWFGSRFDTAYPRDWIHRIRVSWSRDHAIFLGGYGVLVLLLLVEELRLLVEVKTASTKKLILLKMKLVLLRNSKNLSNFFIIAVQTPGSGISILLAVGTPPTGSGNIYCQWELSPDSGNALRSIDTRCWDTLSNTPPDSYSVASHFGGVTDWYQSQGYREPDTIMSDSEDSTVTYTTVSSPCEGRSGDVSPGVDGPPVMPKDPYTYVVAAFQALPPPDYPLPADATPTTDSPGYISESDPDEDLEDDDDEDPEEDPTNYPTDHDDEEEEEEPSEDDADKENEEQDENDDEEEEHPASADSIPPPPALCARVYAVGNAGTKPDANTVTGTFLLNNCYAYVLFDTGADRSFVSTAFSSQFDIAPTVLDNDYVVELADGRIFSVNTEIVMMSN